MMMVGLRMCCQQHRSMEHTCLVSTAQNGGGGVNQRLNVTAYLSVAYLRMASSSIIMHRG